MKAETISADEKKWRAESDAHTLAEANVIRNDPDRYTLASEAARRLADEQMEKAKELKSVAGRTITEKKNSGSEGGGEPGTTPVYKNKHNVFKRI